MGKVNEAISVIKRNTDDLSVRVTKLETAIEEISKEMFKLRNKIIGNTTVIGKKK